jgi:hypothetical protein
MSLIPMLHALSYIVLAADAEGWEFAASDEGISVYSRQRKESSVQEMKATGLIDATPQEVWSALRDYDHYPQTMPYTDEAKVLSKEADDKVIYFYSVINPPLVDRRDYVIKILDESDWRDGQGYLKITWKISDQGAPPLRKGIVRVAINDGYWLLEPKMNGTKTFATYYLYTDPGGSVPKWVVNKGNSTAVPNVFRSIRKVIAANKKK